MSVRTPTTRLLLTALLLLVGGQALAERTTTYFHTDGLGSVVAATNQAGQVLWKKDYAPFGAQIDSAPETERTSYTGKQHDEQIGLTYFGARYFDPEIGRFVSPDPVAFVDDNTMSFNRYLYVNNNPYKYVDPDGKFLNFVAKFVLDVAVNVAINYVTSGSLGIGAALKDSAMGVLNPAKTVAKVKKLSTIVAKADKKRPDVKTAARSGQDAPSVAASATRRPSAETRRQADSAATDAQGKLRCQYCGDKLTTKPGKPNSREYDHVDPWSRSHDSSPGNIVNSCRTCNRSKGARTPEEWGGP